MRPALVLAVVGTLAFAVAAGAHSAVSVPGIRTPTGNIRCVFAARTDPRNSGGLYCSIGRADYAGRMHAGCAGLDWHGWVVSGFSIPQPVCSGGALWFGTPRYLTLAYGHTWRRASYTCRSARTGLTCTNPAGHGLFISRERWRSW